MNRILESLNEEQRKPLLATEGAVLVTAGAGSGKTRMLTHRIAYLIEQGVRDWNILAITFTNKATNEIRERVSRMVEGSGGVWISTFHSLCVKILRSHIDKLQGYNSRFSIYADAERKNVLKRIFNEFGIEEDGDKKSIDFHISNIKNNNVSAELYAHENSYLKEIVDVVKVYNEYQKTLLANNALDFDDLLVMTYRLFTACPQVLEHYADKFKYIHVDEFQDTNVVQYDLLKLLAIKHGNILVVGDEDQSIYGWRGANIKNITNFINDFPGVKVFKLEQNYRSTKKILGIANKIISNNSERLSKTLWTENGQGMDVVYNTSDSDRDEADFVVRNIYRLVNEQGYRYSDIAVLMRYSALSRLIEERLINYNIPYVMLGGFKFFERAEVKNVLAYMRAVVNPDDNESILRIINVPKRGIGESSVEKLLRAGNLVNAINNAEQIHELNSGAKNKIAEFAALYNELAKESTQKKLADFADFLIARTGLRDMFKLDSEEDYERIKNLDALIGSIEDFEKANDNATLAEYLESVTLISDIDTVNEDRNNVLLSTVHAVKGLEFKVVFIIALEDGIFPIIRLNSERPNDIEEERRLMYVAITRAQERLFLTRARRRYLYNNELSSPASRFIREMELDDAPAFMPKPNFERRFDNVKPGFTAQALNTVRNEEFKLKTLDLSGFKEGVLVGHPKFGVGTVTDASKLNNKLVTIDFGGFGVKTLSLDFAPLKILKK